ncbi:MAG: hypothetical protein HQL26_09215 [Candidatus Omnitrophica bacterium]|nr:hypothetical protein [Candidatus Omnitrophota bacterium]
MKNKFLLFGLVMFFMVGLAACSQKPKSANSEEAIQQSQTLKTVDDQVKYLVNEANGFVNTKNYDQAVNIANHILANLDKNSAPAMSVLEKAQAQLKAMADKKVTEMKGAMQNTLGGMGK